MEGIDMFIIVKCAWCQRFLGTKEFEGQIDKEYRISHGICPECKVQVEIETENFLKQQQTNSK
jgi:uncharacterized protein YlaI